MTSDSIHNTIALLDKLLNQVADAELAAGHGAGAVASRLMGHVQDIVAIRLEEHAAAPPVRTPANS